MNYLLGRSQPLAVRAHLSRCSKCRRRMIQVEDQFLAEAMSRDEEKASFSLQGKKLALWFILFFFPYLAEGRDFRFSWQAVNGAAGYEIQLADAMDFAGTVLQMVSYDPSTELKLEPGIFFWRVRAFDREGRRGHWSIPRQLHYKRNPPPVAEMKRVESANPAARKLPEDTDRPALAAQVVPVAEKTQEKEITVRKPVGGQEEYRLLPGKKLTLYFDAKDLVSGLDRIFVRINEGSFEEVPGQKIELAEPGTYAIAWYATDRAGNRSSEQKRNILIERERE
ncbi:MAG: hypothetical protein HS115_04675 [Spirochaetales bacterium]|nr:hypothetical protein [Spirochaetales bacterium]